MVRISWRASMVLVVVVFVLSSLALLPVGLSRAHPFEPGGGPPASRAGAGELHAQCIQFVERRL